MLSNKDVIIRVNSESLEFPLVCPVCGLEATRKRYISRSKKSVGPNGTSTIRRYSRWLPPLPSPTTRFTLGIPVCEKHYKSSSELGLTRSMTTIIAGLSAPLSIALGIYDGLNLYDGILLPFQIYLLTIISWLVLLWSLRGLGTTDLDRTISIVDFAQGNPVILIRVRSGWYVDELLAINPSSKIVAMKRSSPL